VRGPCSVQGRTGTFSCRVSESDDFSRALLLFSITARSAHPVSIPPPTLHFFQSEIRRGRFFRVASDFRSVFVSTLVARRRPRNSTQAEFCATPESVFRFCFHFGAAAARPSSLRIFCRLLNLRVSHSISVMPVLPIRIRFVTESFDCVRKPVLFLIRRIKGLRFPIFSPFFHGVFLVTHIRFLMECA
jgi:hypothetical protein